MQSINGNQQLRPRAMGNHHVRAGLTSGYGGLIQTALAKYRLFSFLAIGSCLGVICSFHVTITAANGRSENEMGAPRSKAQASANLSPAVETNNVRSASARYVATNGSNFHGDGSESKPWNTIAHAIGRLTAGDTLVVKNGVYVGKENFISGVPPGTSTRPTIIAAESPMEVRIQSSTSLGYNDNQLHIAGNHITVDGFIFDMANTKDPPYIGEIEGSFVTVSRSIFKRSGHIDEYGGLLQVGGSDNLFEDLAGVGACRYCFKQGGPSSETQRNIWRRVVGRFDYSNSTQPKATFSTYGNDSIATNGVSNHLYQNVIAIDGQNPGKNGGEEKYGGFYTVKAATNVQLQGCIVLNEGVGYSGMHLRDYRAGNANGATHSVVWDLKGSRPGATGMRGAWADHMTIGGEISGKPVDLGSPAIRSRIASQRPAKNLLDNNPGATIWKRYGKSGTHWGEPGFDKLTTEDLWPWPYQDKIKAVFAERNDPPPKNSPPENRTTRGLAAEGNGLYGGPITLTSYIWEYLGEKCPDTICKIGGASRKSVSTK